MAGSPTSGAAGAAGALAKAARALLIVSLVMLTQFLLGISVNLFVGIPGTHPGAGVADFFAGAWRSMVWVLASEWPLLALHVVVGVGLVAGSLTFLVRGLLAGRRDVLLIWNLVGTLAAASAAFSGIYFVIHPKADLASLQMAIGFAIALAAVIVQIFLLGRAGSAASRGTSAG